MADEELSWKIFRVAITYYGIIVVPLGLLGNVLTMAIMYLDVSLRISTRLLTTALAISDCLVLLVPGLRYWIYLNPSIGIDVRNQHVILCKLHTYCTYMSFDLSVYILALLGIERLALVRFPTASFFKVNLKLKTVLSLLLLFAYLNTKNMLLLWRQYDWQTQECGTFPGENDVFAIFDMVMATLLPDILLITSTAGLLYLMRRRRSSSVKVTNHSTDDTRQGRSTLRSRIVSLRARIRANNALRRSSDRLAFVATKMFLTVAIVYVVTAMPSAIFLIMLNYAPTLVEMTSADYINMGLLWMAVSNAAWPFYLYCAFSYRFQRYILRIICCGRRLQMKIIPTSTIQVTVT